MVEEVIKYKCKICNSIFDDKNDAIYCEEKGIIPLHPIGTIFCMFNEKEMVFAVIKQYPNNYHHHHTYSTWACRDTAVGDNCTGENFCGLESWTKIYPPDTKAPAYKRMIEALQTAGIKPIDYKNEGLDHRAER